MLKISQFSSQGCWAHTRILSDSLRFDPQVQNFKKEDTFMHGVQLSDRWDFPRSSRNLDRKIALRQAKNTMVVSVRETISLEPKLGFLQIQNFKKKDSASFPMTPWTSKTDVGNYVYHARKDRQKIRKTRWKSDAFLLPDNRLRARIPSDSQRFDPRARVCKKDCNSSYETQLSVRR